MMRVAPVDGLPVAAVEQVELARGAEEPDRGVRQRPDALEIRTRLLGDRRRPLGRLAAALIVQLERVEPGHADVGERQVGGRTLLLEHVPRALEVAERRIGPVELPAAAAEVKPGPRRIERASQLVQLPHPLRQQLLARGRLAAQPAELAHARVQERPLARIRNVRQDALEQLGGLGERHGALGLARGAHAGIDRLLHAAGLEQVPGQGERAATASRERIGGSGVDALPLRHDGVGDDRLLV